MAYAPQDQSISAEFGRVRNDITQAAVVTENDPRQGPAGSATAVSLAWGTLQTQVLALTSSVASLNRLQDFIDRAPTLSFRGTP